MKLAYRSDYLSIKSFDAIDLPQISVLTGVNGSGKSHLLRSIKEGNVGLGGINKEDIVLFTLDDFRLENEGAINQFQISQERQAACELFYRSHSGDFRRAIQNFKNEMGESYATACQIADARKQSLWTLTEADFTDQEKFKSLQNYRANFENFLRNHHQYRGDQNAQSILAWAKTVSKSIDEYDESEFKTFYQPYILKNDFLPTHLTKMFVNYYDRYDRNRYNRLLNESEGTSRPVLSEGEFLERYGRKPWVIVNEILAKVSDMPYEINNPEGLDRDDHYTTELIHKIRPGVKPQFSELSSGERVLMALVASVYKASTDRQFPKALLLDEIDASLHPSMMESVFDVIKDVFLARGVQVVFVTHSPTTIALAPEGSVFVVNREGPSRIEHTSKGDALDILTQGYATLEKGVKLLDKISRTDISIFTEGRNVNYISRSLEYYGIHDVEIITGAEDRTGDTQLKVLFDFFTTIPHEKKVIFVWDCDCEKFQSLNGSNNTYPFVFLRNPNNLIAKKGIENLFPESFFEGLTWKKVRPNGDTQEEFDGAYKVQFEERVLTNGTKSDFSLFQPLIDLIMQVRRDGAGK